MQDFIASDIAPLLAKQQLDFDKLWNLPVEAVDEPNTKRGGWSSVAYYELEGVRLYLHRQQGYKTRTLCSPLGEPTFYREFKATQTFERLAIPAITTAYYAERGNRAMMMTYALNDYKELGDYHQQWAQLDSSAKNGIIKACAELVRTLHQAKQMHGCLYPKHVFVKKQANGSYQAKFINLEKVRTMWFAFYDRTKDLETFKRRSNQAWSEQEWQTFFTYYDEPKADYWRKQIAKRQARKES